VSTSSFSRARDAFSRGASPREALAPISALLSAISLFGLGQKGLQFSIVEAFISAALAVATAIAAVILPPRGGRFFGWLSLGLALTAAAAAGLALAAFAPCGANCL
jgi:hypothetical protein